MKVQAMTIHHMKGILVTMCTVFAVLAAASCGREPVPVQGGGRRSVSFVVDDFRTRASVTLHEAEVASLDVLVFRSDNGTLDNAARVPAAGGQEIRSISVELSDGVPLDWYVVANAPEGVLSFLSESGFQQGLTLLSQSTETSLLMHGSGFLPEGPVPSIVPVHLERYACKVTLKSLTVDWPDAFTASGEVALGRIVLVNVAGSTPWSGTPAAGDLWYNKMGIETGLPPIVEDLILKDYGGMPLRQGIAADVESTLYCLPNPTANNVHSANAPEWSVRNTRIAVEILVGGVPNWYPVSLPGMRGNHHYVINSLTVKGPGAIGPDYPVEREDIRFAVTVADWDDTAIPVVY